MARLILSLRGRELDKFLLGQGKAVIGRSPDCDISIDNSAISRKHASIEFKDGDYFLTDLESSNGTFLNGDKIEGLQLLKPGDNIGIAKFTLTFQETPQAEVQKLMGDDANLEATVVVDAEKMVESFAAPGNAATSTVSGPRKLVVLKGNSNIKELAFEHDVITIGKSKSCDLIIPGFWVSKVEATISHRKNNYYLNPLGGSLKLNTQKISKETILKVGDTFAVGKAVIAFT
ncbi:MAG: FHA domain-containing protein [Deltaproteobacteria bacterium]|nr:FHA domain-containing protein [Deltaproteobacteria bacterium]MBW2052625.1 FHA domain-containing protein [Deltaproteobacteria bacterium]MBW2140732.1 FHA domain-containing protein [Deltaproteobacteria bacterium]MBW2324228.1 FHA domain-containing protein [Deltaproteobacteria bacterium]